MRALNLLLRRAQGVRTPSFCLWQKFTCLPLYQGVTVSKKSLWSAFFFSTCLPKIADRKREGSAPSLLILLNAKFSFLFFSKFHFHIINFFSFKFQFMQVFIIGLNVPLFRLGISPIKVEP